MVPEKLITEFVQRVRQAAGVNLKSVILYGSAAAGDYIPEHSDINLLFVFGETSFTTIANLAPTVEWWARQKHHAPLLMTAEDLRRGADVFSIEFLDMKESYRVLWGEDLLKGLEIPMRFHRVQLEYELREKMILLRQRLLLVAGNEGGKWDLLLRSVPAFGTLARHALIALGEKPAASKREAIERLGANAGFDPAPILQLFDIRDRKVDRKTIPVDQEFDGYLKAVERITVAVDDMLER
jgi:predicted nucleotidyltransferase